MSKSVAFEKSFAFAVRAVKCYQILHRKSEIQPIAKQFMRSATSIGANLAEAQDAQSRADFLSKASISLKEARETHYWICLMSETGILSKKQAESLQADCNEILCLLTAIVKTTRSGSK